MATEYRFTIPCTMPLPPPLPPHNLLGPREIVVINSNSTTCKTAASASRGTTGDHRLFAHRHVSENRTFNSRSVPGRIFVLLFRLGRETKKKKKKRWDLLAAIARESLKFPISEPRRIAAQLLASVQFHASHALSSNIKSPPPHRRKERIGIKADPLNSRYATTVRWRSRS